VDYHVPTESYARFTRIVQKLKGVRLRGGAVRWGIYRDANNPEHLNETFIMESWMDFLRSRERMTQSDFEIREQVYALHKDPEGGSHSPKISFQVWASCAPGGEESGTDSQVAGADRESSGAAPE
jgi:hypothetical protein